MYTCWSYLQLTCNIIMHYNAIHWSFLITNILLDGWPAYMAGCFYESAVFWQAFYMSKNTQPYWLVSRLIRCLLYNCFLLTLIKSSVFFIYTKIARFCLIPWKSRRFFNTGKKPVRSQARSQDFVCVCGGGMCISRTRSK